MLRRTFLSLALSLVLAAAAPAGAAEKVAEKAAANPVVVMETTLGKIRLELFPKEAPLSVKNFLEYVNSGYYNGTIFHRVIPGFMAQGGGFTESVVPKGNTNPPIKNEGGNGLKNDRGTIAMARTSFPDSATSQFFINVVNNENLNRPKPDGFGYAVFGKVVEGMEVVDKIVNTPTGVKNGMPNVPVQTVVIKSVKVAK
ncbi:MAG TPA: peptidylprolyl isomerase [Verrucomicrobiae bacterium]|nr:peptidylprolyl isomerase [Verrucomicrobiae bacterium]